MADVKWVRVSIEMFNDPKLKIINSMEEKDLINYVWMRTLLLAGRSNKDGSLFINDNMPYTMKTLAIEFDRTLDEIKLCFKILRKLEMIEFNENKIFMVKNWAKHQNIEGLEKLKKQNCERVAKHRAKKRQLEENINDEELSIADNKKGKDNLKCNNENIEDELSANISVNLCATTETLNDDNNKVTYNNTETFKTEKHNITENKGNITVMEQNKKENKTKKKNKIEIENSKGIDEKNASQDTGKVKFEKECNSILSTAAIKLLQHYEQVTGIMGGLDIGSLRLAISTHGEENVRKAIDEAIETGKTKGNMRYINGILRNWRKEGYPEDDVGGINNGAKSNGKGSRADSKQFKGIKPKKCRELTEEERKNLGAALI
ncbi:MAG: phage replisome organizer N-terminal domain-containing protein [Clostridium sp.]|uniref:phage replisome organizer N-terminal domain-containing protein n=1 Tax=Clostridium sp. TaxID=1506 RepID=UPI0028FEC0C2|nr:phage replisome organizer N-terminal domain-containing protein [Clostridium sp.]MDU1229872.1 phage replisome organizer N-terminal domain-containing protein [Clostridium sp.]